MIIAPGESKTLQLSHVPEGSNVLWRSTFKRVLLVKKISNDQAQLTGVICGNARVQAIVDGKTYICRIYVKNTPVLSMKAKFKNIHTVLAASGQFTNVTAILIRAGRRHAALYDDNGKINASSAVAKRSPLATGNSGGSQPRQGEGAPP